MTTLYSSKTSLSNLLFVFLFCFLMMPEINASVVYSSLLSGQKVEEGNKIRWSTASEVDCDFFLLEKSYDGITFDRVAIIKGAGNSEKIRHYDYTDSLEKSLRIFYRLLPVDTEGRGEYTHSIVLSDKGPNAKFYIDYVSAGMTQRIFQAALNSKVEDTLNYRVMTQLGKIEVEGEIPVANGTNFVSIDLNDLKTGDYQLALQVSNDIEVIALKKLNSPDIPTATLEVEKRN